MYCIKIKDLETFKIYTIIGNDKKSTRRKMRSMAEAIYPELAEGYYYFYDAFEILEQKRVDGKLK